MGTKVEQLKATCVALGRKYVGMRGNPRAPLWFVGEAPGETEEQVGYPFVGSGGRLLDTMLAEAGINPKDCCFINPYKTRPPENDISRIEECGIPRAQHEEAFFEELRYYRPTFIIPLGGTSLSILCPSTIDPRDGDSKISKWRGSILQSDFLDWNHYIIPNFHPAYILREYSDKAVAVFIFGRVAEEFEFYRQGGNLQPLPSRELIAEPSFDESKEFLLDLLGQDRPVSADIELIARRVPITIALSNDRNRALSLAFFEGDPAHLAILWRLLDKVLATKHIIGQNWTTFDSNWLNALGFNPGMDLVDDTLVRHHVLWPEMSHKLDFQIMQYTHLPYYKDDGKGWRLKEGLKKLMRYNCLDACGTLEVYEEQEKEFQERPSLARFYHEYEMPLARFFFRIDQRGILTDPVLMSQLRASIVKELGEKCVSISQNLGGRPVVYSDKLGLALAKELKLDKKVILNIASVQQLKDVLKNDLKIKLALDKETHKESTGEESLNEAFAKTQSPVLKDILRTRELNKVLGTYVNAKLNNNVFYSCYSVTGTVTGRRASRKTFLGYGSNGQNRPKHSDLGERFQGVFIARPGRVFVCCDQASAEEWIVQGIIADVSGDTRGIVELKESIRTGISRHAILASQIFQLPIEKVNDKECLEYYMGKKTRHACNYDMRENTMASQMAAEGFPVGVKFCLAVQTTFHKVEPNIRGVFHKHVQQELLSKRLLRTPLGRERTFFGLHPTRDNGKVFREAYAYIPQSTVGDNNGLAILYCEQHQTPGVVVMDGHDSCMLEVEDSEESVLSAIRLLRAAYDRIIKFPNGFEVKIPIDYKIGYSIKGLVKCPGNLNETGSQLTSTMLKARQSHQKASIGGQQSPESQQPLNETSGSIA